MKGKILVTCVLALALSGSAMAGSALNEVGAFLVYPAIVALDGNVPDTYESYVTVTNSSATAVDVHFSYISGETNASYCDECDFTIPLTGNDTELLIIRWDPVGGVVIETEPDGNDANAIQISCDWNYGFLIAALEEAGPGNATLTDNVLFGEQIVVNYTDGYALSLPAISLQGGDAGNGDRIYDFNDAEYTKLPRVVAADFIAPDINSFPLNAQLVLFALDFRRAQPPFSDCSVTGYDADENPFSRSIQFGCWDWFDLYDISTEFAYPNLGLGAGASDTHGWLQLACQVNGKDGGVHGAIVQRAAGGTIVRRNDPAAPALPNPAAWSRVLYQSVTTGDAMTLRLN